MTSETVRLAGARADLNHRDPLYRRVVVEIKDILREEFSGFHPYLIGGSGTAAMEAAASSLIREGDKVLVLTDGYYAERMRDLVDLYCREVHYLEFDWLKGWDLGMLEGVLETDRYEWVVLTHHETTTGRLNPVEQAAALAKAHGAKVMVDAMSSLGGDPLDFTDLDAVIASANKCFHGLPGVSFVLTRELAPRHSPRTYYLHLPRYEGDNPPLTPPVPAMLSFWQALAEWRAAGAQAGRHAQYQELIGLIRETLEAKGYRFPIPPERASSTMLLCPLPLGTSYQAFFDFFYSQGYVLYQSKKDLAEETFIVSVMGEVSRQQVESWLKLVPGYRG